MSLERINLTLLRAALCPTNDNRRRASFFNRAFIWRTIDYEDVFFRSIFLRLRDLRDGALTDSDFRVLQALYGAAAFAQQSRNELSRECLRGCCAWREITGGHLLQEACGGDWSEEKCRELNRNICEILRDISQRYDSRPIITQERQESLLPAHLFEQLPAPTPEPKPAPPREPSVLDVPHCCAAQILHKWGCGDPDGYDVAMGVSDVEELFRLGWFNRLRPVQIAVLQEYQIEEGLGKVLEANGWECLRDGIKNNRGLRTLSIWAYFRDVDFRDVEPDDDDDDVEPDDDDDDYYEDEEDF